MTAVRTIFTHPGEFRVPPVSTALSPNDAHLVRMIARLLHKALSDAHYDDYEAGPLGAGRAIGQADAMVCALEDTGVKHRAIGLCDHVYRACDEIRRTLAGC